MERTLISIKCVLSLLLILFFHNCGMPPRVEKEDKIEPAIVIKIGSIYIGNLNKRPTKEHAEKLVSIIKREKIEAFAIQDLTRYPDVSTRVDLLNELDKRLDYRKVIGEMENINGKQVVNVVFSYYPIISYYNQSFETIKSALFESALLVEIDAGLRSITLASTKLPNKANITDKERCIEMMMESDASKRSSFFIIAGNLPSLHMIKTQVPFKEVAPVKHSEKSASKMWHRISEKFKLLNSYELETELGYIIIAEIGIFY